MTNNDIYGKHGCSWEGGTGVSPEGNQCGECYPSYEEQCPHLLKRKQIEEMALDIDTVMQGSCFHKSCHECEFDLCDTCKATMLATTLINDYGYHKSSEIMREIFAEIEGIMAYFPIYGHTNTLIVNENDFAELKNKYEEGGE